MRSRLVQVSLIIGFISISSAVHWANQSHATTYELSLYASTPIVFWVSALFSLCISIVWMLKRKKCYDKQIISLYIISITSIIMVPVIRGYYFFGESDAMSHLGMARSTLSGVTNIEEILYPGISLLSILYSNVTGTDLQFAMMFLALLFPIFFILFSVVFVRRFFAGSTTAFGIIITSFLLPINLISVEMHAHPTTHAILYSVLLLFITLSYYRHQNIGWGCSMVLSYIGLLLLHPQIASALIITLTMIAFLKVAESKLLEDYTTNLASFIHPIILFGIIFWVWAETNERFESGLISLLTPLFFDTETAGRVADRGLSLSQIGTSLEELFIRVFLLDLIICIIAFVVFVSSLITYYQGTSTDNTNKIILYLGFGSIPLLVAFLFLLIGNVTTQYFRYLGLIMVITTLISIPGISKIHLLISQDVNKQAIFSIIIIVAIFSAILVYFPSPYMFQPNHQVTEGQMTGYGSAIEYSNPDLSFWFVRSETDRYFDAEVSHVDPNRGNYYSGSHVVEDNFYNNSLHKNTEKDRYLAITAADRVRDPVLYQGFRFSEEDFEYLDTDESVNKLYNNGGFDLYLVERDIDSP